MICLQVVCCVLQTPAHATTQHWATHATTRATIMQQVRPYADSHRRASGATDSDTKV